MISQRAVSSVFREQNEIKEDIKECWKYADEQIIQLITDSLRSGSVRMGNSTVRYAVFMAFMMLAGHLFLQYVPQYSQLEIENLFSAVFPSRSVERASATSLDDEIIVPMKWEGVWVADVEINDLHEVKMIVDTGASGIALSSEAAFDIGLSPNQQEGKGMSRTANGSTEVWFGRIRSIRLGEAEQNNVRVSVLENFGVNGRDGLLGLQFLNGFHWYIDQQAGNLILRPRT